MIRRRLSRGEWIVHVVRNIDSVTRVDIFSCGLLVVVMAVAFFLIEGKS